MSTTPSAQYSSGVIGAVDLVEVGERPIRDITIDAAGQEHRAAIDAVAAPERRASPATARATAGATPRSGPMGRRAHTAVAIA